MPEISHQKFAGWLKDQGAVQRTSVYLLHGEEFLYRKVLQGILDLLMPGEERAHNCIVMEGGSSGIANALAELNTFSFLGGGKIVIINDAGFMGAEPGGTDWVEKIEAALTGDNPKKAAQLFLKWLSQAGHRLEDITEETKLLTAFRDPGAIHALIRYCRENNIQASQGDDQGEFLQQSIKKGFPTHHHLIITSDGVDRRRRLFKVIKEQGLVVDCSVPKGARKADRDAQDALLQESSKQLLSRHDKAIEPEAYRTLCEMTGFDLAAFTHNLEKLVDFVGQRKLIQSGDVKAVVARSRQDPIFAYTNAILNRDAKEALFLLDSLLRQELHPLQVITATIKQLRNLMMAKEFALSEAGRVWSKGCPYNRFTTQVLPAIEAFDRNLATQLDVWRKEIAGERDAGGPSAQKKKKKGSGMGDSDLLVAKNPKNPYPIYQLMLRTDLFSRQEILASMERLSQADYQMKTSPRSPRLLLEDAILFICNVSLNS